MGRQVKICQPTVPTYTLDFFDRLSRSLDCQLVVYGSEGGLGVLTSKRPKRPWERALGPITNILPGVEWQRGALSIPVDSGDIIVVSGGPRCLSNLMLLLKARVCGAKTVWWGHYWSSTSRPWRFALRLLLMQLSDVLLLYTDKEMSRYRDRMGSWQQPVFALNNGLAADEIQKHRRPYVAAERARSLLFISRLTTKGEISVLLKALANPLLEDVRLEVIGSGEMEWSLRDESQRLGVQDRITWHGGMTDEAEISRIVNHCLLFVYPGAVGLSLIHAMGYGLPAILHGDRLLHGPEADAFDGGITGLIFKKGDSADLAIKIAQAMSDPLQLEKWSSIALDRFDRDFNTESMGRRFIEMVAFIKDEVQT